MSHLSSVDSTAVTTSAEHTVEYWKETDEIGVLECEVKDIITLKWSSIDEVLSIHSAKGTIDLDHSVRLLSQQSTPEILIEWMNPDTKSYSCFDLLSMVEVTRLYHSLSDSNNVIPLSVLDFDHRKDTKDDSSIISQKKVGFTLDESEIDEILLKLKSKQTWILIRSPNLHSSQKSSIIDEYSYSSKSKYSITDLGEFKNGYHLYLGGYPSESFLNAFHISHLINVSKKKGNASLLSLCERGETHWDILSLIQQFRNKHTESYDYCVQRLDEMVDQIHNELHLGNVLIHCAAGMHRSPFMVACYLCKYSHFTSVSKILDWLVEMRPEVEPCFQDVLEFYHSSLIHQSK